MKTVDVCLSPDLMHLYDATKQIVVVVDILRATSCITTALAHGVSAISPHAHLEDCRRMKALGYFIAGERNGEKVDGFDLGNSPFEYMKEELKGKKVAFTTTNGTQAIAKASGATETLIGSFLNLSALANYLSGKNDDILIICSGWKGHVNLEDTVFAGALIDYLNFEYKSECDAPVIAHDLYKREKANLIGFLQNSSHVKRLGKLNIDRDIEFCLTPDQFHIVPRLTNGEIVV